ncbi:Cro [compost metagenome]
MKRIPFREFVEQKGQIEAAAALGVTQGAISKALRVGRDIYVTEHDDGTFTAEELRPFPSQHPKKPEAA